MLQIDRFGLKSEVHFTNLQKRACFAEKVV